MSPIFVVLNAADTKLETCGVYVLHRVLGGMELTRLTEVSYVRTARLGCAGTGKYKRIT